MTDDLMWELPDDGMGHYGPHQPISTDTEVVCAKCGAVAPDADPEEYP